MNPSNIIFVIMVFFSCCISGCVRQLPYSYDNIRKDYAEIICRLSPLEESEDGTSTCALNKTIGLSESIKIALKNNPDMNIALSRIQQAEAMLNLTKAAFLPYFGLYAEYLKGDAPSAYLFKKIDQRELPSYIDFNDPGTIDNYETGINAKLNLYNGGRDMLNNKISETGLTISHLDKQAVQNTLTAAVIRSYYNALAAKDYIQIAKESVGTVEAELNIMRVRFEAGGALKSDILSLEVRLAEAREDVLQSVNRYKMAITALANVLGVSPDNQLSLKQPDLKNISIPIHYVEGMTYGLEHRPEIKQAQHTVIQARIALDAARAEYLPNVNLQARHYFDNEDINIDIDHNNYSVALICRWDMFTGFSTQAQIKKASAALEQALAADRRTTLFVKTDIKNAYLKMEEANARLEVAQKSLTSAEESLSLVRKQYEGGSVPITRYLEAELDLNSSRMRSTTAFFDRENAIADIARAIGYWGIKS